MNMLPAAMARLFPAYGVAADPRDTVWAFPRGKAQLFSSSPRGLSNGVKVYAFGRRLPRFVQASIALQIRVPGLRRLVSQRQARVEAVCGRQLWQEIAALTRQRHSRLSGEWLQFSSQWDKQRSSFVGINVDGQPELFLTIEKHDDHPRAPMLPATSYRVPACRHAFRHGGWSVREVEPLPRFHRPAAWDPARIRQVSADVSRTLRLERPADTPAHWLPMHGDLVPWNLREDTRGQLWLLDWEDAGWGPPFADLVRFIVAHHSLGSLSPQQVADQARSVIGTQSADAAHEAAAFWLRHHNVKLEYWARQSTKDAARKVREFEALRALAGGAE